MSARTIPLLLMGLIVFWIVTGCDVVQEASGPDNHPVAYIDADGTHESTTRDTLRNPFPHLLMADGRISANDRCPVRKVPLNKRLPALLANGRPIGFC